MLLKATQTYINYIEASAHYLGCPTQRFNESLHSLYRQGISTHKSVENVIVLLKAYNYSNPKITANWLVQQYKTISTKEFNKLNVSLWGDELPNHIKQIDDKINDYFERNKWYYFNGVYGGTKSYPFKTQ